MEEAEVLCDRIAVMDAGRIIACDTPAGLIRMLDLDAVVSGTLAPDEGREAMSLTEAELAALPAVVNARLESGEQHRVTLRSRDVQATIVGFLELAASHRLRIADLASTRASLEDVFLQLTGREFASEDDVAEDDDAAKAERKGQ
jgi:ABC-2 type transport system ATP-binding protein